MRRRMLQPAIARHSDDGELSIRSPEGEELLIANRGYVLMCRDISYWKTLNEVLEMEDFEHERLAWKPLTLIWK